jgi:hypothetical protein
MRNRFLILLPLVLLGCNSEKEVEPSPYSVYQDQEKISSVTDTIHKKSSVKSPEAFKCNVSLWTNSSGKNGAFAIYPNPFDSGQKLIKLNAACDHIASVYESVNGWFHLSAIYTSDDCEDKKAIHQNLEKHLPCWVKAGSLSVGVAGSGGGDTFKLFRNPYDTALVIGYTNSTGWTPLAASKKWLLVKGLTKEGKETTGWIPPEVQCMNPFTNCCNDFSRYIFSLLPPGSKSE